MKKAYFLFSLMYINTSILVFSQTSGPSTPEVQKFTPSSTDNLVNLFSGDFQYTIPIMDVGGYPINISYSSNLSMSQEAGVVGLGWSFNPGVINRNIRGIPDDFKGDEIKKTYKTKPSLTFSTTVGMDIQLFSIGALDTRGTVGTTLSYNNYRGLDISLSKGLSGSIGNFKLGLTSNSGSSGSSLNPSLSYTSQIESNKIGSQQLSLSGSFSTLEGLKSVSFSRTLSSPNPNDKNDPKTGSSSAQYNFPLGRVKQSFSPKIESATWSTSMNLGLRLGLSFVGTSGGITMSGLFSEEHIKNYDISKKAFGYLNLSDAGEDDLMDKSNEKERPIFEKDNNLFLTYLEPDIFSVTGEGINGSFRAFRTNIINAHDPKVSTEALSGDLGFEGHIAYGDHIGINGTATFAISETTQWSNLTNNPQNFYFKNIGELNGLRSKTSFKNSGGFEASNINLDNNILQNTINIESLAKLKENTNTQFTYLNADIAERVGLNKKLLDYNSISIERPDSINRNVGYRKAHHISEIIVTTDEGVRYVYGLPAYNIVQKEYSFNVKDYSSDEYINTISFDKYISGIQPGDNTIKNKKGRSEMFSVTEIPAYVYAYHLTAILSTDYIDLTGNGPTSDDFGTYTRFNYALKSSNFAWRTPYKQGEVNYNAGYLSDAEDQTGNYVYGEKEIWNLHSIESRNTVARFEYVDREDGVEPIHEPTGGGLQKSQALSTISLYTKSEYISQPSPTPIKKVYFEYDYSLCKGIPANPTANGKLTLKKLKYSYGTSLKEKNSYYAFNYNSVINPNFDVSKTDKWGSYRTNNFLGLPQKRTPYSEQSPSLANNDAKAWTLNEIKLPNGGRISIDYEADDYAFVQDKKAMQMFKVLGFSSSPNIPFSNELYNNSTHNQYVIVELDKDVSNDELSLYFQDLNQIYINSIVELKDGKKEEIKTFIELKKIGSWYGLMPLQRKQAWIKIDDKREYLNGINAIAFDSWQKLLHERRDLLLPAVFTLTEGADIDALSNVAEDILTGGLIGQLVDMIRGFRGQMESKAYGKTIFASESFVRLFNGNHKKIGGGSRVKEIKIYDNWNTMSNGASAESFYGQSYDYTIQNGGRILSSGIASYEPMIGGDENPFVEKEGEFILGSTDKLSNERKYYISPFGESVLPSPSVGYSKVIVRNIERENITKHATGRTEHEFYTAKDFPTILHRTGIVKRNPQSDPIGDAFAAILSPYSETSNHLSASQGFYIELNDMHGKQKSVKTYGSLNSEKVISGNEYKYLTNPLNEKQLSNEVLTIDNTLRKIQIDTVGIEYDYFVEMLESKSYSREPGLQFNSEGIWWPFPPLYIPIPIPIPSWREDENKLNLKLSNKIVYRSGILSEVITIKENAEFFIKNVLFDNETGKTIITQSQNEFKEPYFITTIPAHWFYDGMGFASKNEGSSFNIILPSTNEFNTALNQNFYGGEEVYIKELDQPKAWVFKKVNGNFTLINEKGENIPSGTYTAKTIRSGFRNMQSVPIQTVVSKANPISGNSLLFDKVIDANATQFDNTWQTYLAFRPTLPKVTCECIDHEPLKLRMCGSFSQVGTTVIPSNNILNIFAPGNPYAVLSSQVDGKTIHFSIYDTKYKRIICEIKIRLSKFLPTDATYFCLEGDAFPKANSERVCGESNLFYGKLSIGSEAINTRVTMEYELESSCIISKICSTKVENVEDPINCNIIGNQKIVNPYILGILGNWRPSATYKYVIDRNYVSSIALKDKGIYNCFKSFFDTPMFQPVTICSTQNNWQRADLSAIVDPYGKSIESLDALNRPSSQIFGYGHQLPLITAINAHYYEIGFDGFEDHNFKNQVDSPFKDCIVEPTWQFDLISSPLVVRNQAPIISSNYISSYVSHTGRRSIRVSTPFSIQKNILPTCIVPFDIPIQANPNSYVLNDCELIKTFTPLKKQDNQKYKISAWVKEDLDIDNLSNPISRIFVSTTGLSPINVELKPDGQIIDGWRQINGEFDISGNESTIRITLSPSSVGRTYFDDIRVFPFNASVKTHVFDPYSLRLMAELDENNFASFYEYNEEGSLVRTKKETERGIFTIQEVRNAKFKSNN